jgi:endo-1,4-beta-xylanase
MRHTYSVVSYYKKNYPGLIIAYDVVNEHISSEKNNPPWMAKRSSGDVDLNDTFYIEAAFIAAHKADPKAKLFFCDYNCESTWGNTRRFRDLIDFIKNIKSKYKEQKLNFPIHGVAFQGHYILDFVIGRNPLNNNNYIRSIQSYIKNTLKPQVDIITNELGLDFQFTEMDIVNMVRYLAIPGDSDYSKKEVDDDIKMIRKKYGGTYKWDTVAVNNFNIIQAEFLKQLYAYLKTNPKCTTVSFWGLNDKVSWRAPDFIRKWYMPTIFDYNNNPKPSYYALKSML